MASAFNHLEMKLIELIYSDFVELRLCIENLESIATTYCENQSSAVKGARHGAIAATAGGAIGIVGLALAPFTLGISLAVSGAAAAVSVGGATGVGIWSKKSTSHRTKFKQDIEAELRAFQEKIIPMARKLKDISECIKEIFRDLNDTEHNVSYLSKYFASSCELVRFLQTYDADGLAAKISETVSLSGDITDILARVSTDIVQKLLDVFSECLTLRIKLNEIETQFKINR